MICSVLFPVRLSFGTLVKPGAARKHRAFFMVKKTSGECACGEATTKRNTNKEWVCDGCRDLQRRGKEINGHYANYGRRERCTEELEVTEEPPQSIAQDAISRLERMLSSI